MKIRKEYTVESLNEDTVTVEVDLTAWSDPKFGADIDGNRGVYVADIEEYDYDEPTETDDGVPLTKGDLDHIRKQIEQKVYSEDASSMVSEHVRDKREAFWDYRREMERDDALTED